MTDAANRKYVASVGPEAMDPPRSSSVLWEWLSNELRNSLAPIVSAVDLLHRSSLSETELTERWWEIVHTQSARLVQLADDLLDLSRACEGTLRVERRELDLASLLSSARESCTPVLQAQGQVLSVELPPDPVRFWGDAGRLVLILKTLLLGAARSMREDPLRLLVRSTDTELEMRVGDPELDVTDEWMSDPPGVLQAREASCEPLGVTLALARHVIELHGGSLEVGGTLAGSSSEFAIRLPLSAPEHLAPHDPAPGLVGRMSGSKHPINPSRPSPYFSTS
jgi:two-component system, sensor histidine kinase